MQLSSNLKTGASTGYTRRINIESPTFTQELADALGVDLSTIEEVDAFVNLVEWDSLAVISAIALIDDYFHITVSTEDLRVCKSLAGLFALIELAKN